MPRFAAAQIARRDSGRRRPDMSSVVTKDSRRHAMARVRWGILSTSRFAQTKVLPAWRHAEHVELAAIASRDLAQARTLATDHGIARAYGSYDELLADPEVDAIYNPLPNHLHVPWSIRALDAGKHVEVVGQ